MGLSTDLKEKLLQAARSKIGTSYGELPCNKFVHEVYQQIGLKYENKLTSQFSTLKDISFIEVDFKKRDLSVLEPGDILLFEGHMGIWDPQGCSVLPENLECKRLGSDLPVLSSRSKGNRGPDFGKTEWFGKVKAVYRWK